MSSTRFVLANCYLSFFTSKEHVYVFLFTSTGKFKVRVIFEYTAKDEDELTIIENQIIKFLAVISEGWWYGESNGSTGLFPSNYVEV